ncbi:TetR/AcrR family transcriptional regulator [Nonomuraea sp. NPDC059194]|uniref:TetR/AcrR family transcriptional regulator n=1 Tax=Nonomuraea sp. NPDC059194 TaxID=3346764 RepID=UPI00369A852A
MDQVEAILRAATQLFAALGYDGTSTSQIAEAAGLDLATVNAHLGGKRELYLAVMERAHQGERAMLEQAIAETEGMELPDRIHRIADRYLDFFVDNPDVSALWLHRWLLDASDVTELERQYIRPLLSLVGEVTGADTEMALWMVVWCVNGFVRGGILDEEGRRRGADDRVALRRFRSCMHLVLHRSLGFPGDPPSA